jgi:hypothetical protein
MPKGVKRADQYRHEQQRYREEAFFFVGWLKSELEHFCNQKALEPVAFAAGVGELWLSNSGQRDDHRMPILQGGGNYVAAREGSRAVAEAQGGDGAYEHGTRARQKAQGTGAAAADQVVKKRTPWSAKRRREQAERARKLNRKFHGTKSKPQANKKQKRKKLNPERMAAQVIYVKRSQLRAAGVPEDQLPPLPKKKEAA